MIDASPIDTDSEVPLAACNVKPMGTPQVAGMVGPGGGTTRPDIACAAGEFPIGFDFLWDDPIVGTFARCGRLARGADGTITTTPTDRFGDPGDHGTCIGPSPDAIAEQTCPQGQVLVGITVDNITSSYNSFAMQCQPLTSAIEITGDITSIAFTGTGAGTNNLESASCGAGMAIVSFGLKSGCDQDQLVVRCAPLICE